MNENLPKILLVSSEFPPNVGGIGNHAYNLAKAFSKGGYSISVVANAEYIPIEELKAFSEKQSFPIYYIMRSKILIDTYIKRVQYTLRYAKQADVIICSGKFSLWLANTISFFYPKKQLIAIAHGSELDIKSGYAKKLTTYSLNKFSKIISVSSYTQKFLPPNLSSSIKKYVIPNGIDISEFEGQSKTNEELPGNPSLITVGSVTERKGQENVIRALPAILQKFPFVQYHIVGKPVLQKKLETIAKELSVADKIKFYGAVSRQQLISTLRAAKIKLMLSNHTNDGDFEGFGIAVLEANAFGIPVIGSRNSGIADAIKDNETGILVDPKNDNEICHAIENIMNNYESFSAKAIMQANEHDWKSIIKRYIAVINE